jgi:hypothetical protein
MSHQGSRPQWTEEKDIQRQHLADRLLELGPRNMQWDSLALAISATGSKNCFIVRVCLDGKEVGRIAPEDSVRLAALRIRELMSQPGHGTWLSMKFEVWADRSGTSSTYNHDKKPSWESGEPNAEDYADELSIFPREDEHIPEWFKDELKGIRTPSQEEEDERRQEAHNLILEQTAEAIDAAWSEVGSVDPILYTHIINPAFLGGPSWLGLRQAFQKVDNVGRVSIVASDGLSDPWLNGNSPVGDGLEVYLAAKGLVGKGILELDQVFQFKLLYMAAQVCADNPGIIAALGHYGALVLHNIQSANTPKRWRNSAGHADVMAGVNHPHVPSVVPTPNGDVALVGIALLHPKETAYINQGGPEARTDVAEKLRRLPPELLNNPRRKPVVSG